MSHCQPGKNVCCGGACMTKGSYSIITWEDPKKSGIALGSILSSLLLIKYVNIPSLLFYLFTLGFLLGSGMEYIGKTILGKSLVNTYIQPYIAKIQLSDKVEYYAPHVVTVYKKLESKLIDLILVKQTDVTFKAGILSYILYLVFKWVSLWNLIFGLTILAFAVPPVYLANQKVIDSNVEKYVACAKKQAEDGIKSLDDKLGPHLKKVKEIANPVIQLLESKLPVRTAGSTVETDAKTTTTSSQPHVAEGGLKQVNKSTLETEVDFNALGEQLKKEAEAQVHGGEAYSKDKPNTTSI